MSEATDCFWVAYGRPLQNIPMQNGSKLMGFMVVSFTQLIMKV